MEKYRLYLVNKFIEKPFFKRFDLKTLSKYLMYGKPKVYDKNEIIYLKGKIGVIYSGSIKIISHSKGLLIPYTEVRNLAGRIIGHESDNGISKNS